LNEEGRSSSERIRTAKAIEEGRGHFQIKAVCQYKHTHVTGLIASGLKLNFLENSQDTGQEAPMMYQISIFKNLLTNTKAFVNTNNRGQNEIENYLTNHLLKENTHF